MAQDLIAVVGAPECEPFIASMAYEVGRGIAAMGAVLVTGGGSGVMEAACRGANESGGQVIGLLAGSDSSEANSSVDIALVTNLGPVRNAVIVQSAHIVIAIGGGYETLSAIAIALKSGRKVIGLATWEIPGVFSVPRPKDALEQTAEELARRLIP